MDFASTPFARFIVSPAGRATRIGAGLALLIGGLARRDTAGGKTAAVLSLVPLAAGALDLCVLAPLFGAPLDGEAVRRAGS
ncbi:MAG: DUF2892 domain-containing protein [Rhodothermales bacterium]